jgi:UDP-N-acetylglucosamine--dolichyl-phosphate N-acetylglucosaminephosphotransferase
MMGAVCAMVYLFVIIFFIPWPFYKDIVVATSGGGNRDFIKELELIETGRLLHRFPHNKLASYLSAILSLQTIVLLGVGDDLFDIRWRHKVLIPAFAVIPMLVVYFVDFGVTQMVVPVPLRPYLGELFDLGMLSVRTAGSYSSANKTQGGSTMSTWHSCPSSLPTVSTSWQASTASK